jgi:hypothetical protein
MWIPFLFEPYSTNYEDWNEITVRGKLGLTLRVITTYYIEWCKSQDTLEMKTHINRMMAVFWVVAPCSLVEVYRRFRLFAASIIRAIALDGGSKHIWNVGKLLPDYTEQQPRRQPSSYSPPWEPEISHINIFPYDVAFNLIIFHVCPYKYIYKQMHKYFFYMKYSKWLLSTLIQPWSLGRPACPDFCTILYNSAELIVLLNIIYEFRTTWKN